MAATESSELGNGKPIADAASPIPPGGGLARAGNGKWIMPEEEVQFLLSLEIDQIPAHRRDTLLPHQAWVRQQYEANDGVVLLDDEMATRRAIEQDFVDILRDLDLLSGDDPISQWEVSDRYSDFFESDDDEEEEVVVHQEVVGTDN